MDVMPTLRTVFVCFLLACVICCGCSTHNPSKAESTCLSNAKHYVELNGGSIQNWFWTDDYGHAVVRLSGGRYYDPTFKYEVEPIYQPWPSAPQLMVPWHPLSPRFN